MGLFNDHWEEHVYKLKEENAELRQRLGDVSAELIAVNFKLIDAEKELAEIKGKLSKFGEIFAKDQWLLNHTEIKQEFNEIFGGE